MKKYRCNTCAGEYSDQSRDGIAYFHACPREADVNGDPKDRKDKRDENVGVNLEGKGKSEI